MGKGQRPLVPTLASMSVRRAVELVAGNDQEIGGMRDRERLQPAVDQLLVEG
tara:strand:- start:32876 stop:33031 length:156 start_codon:yes stop_codon:yes gene_type:complete